MADSAVRIWSNINVQQLSRRSFGAFLVGLSLALGVLTGTDTAPVALLAVAVVLMVGGVALMV